MNKVIIFLAFITIIFNGCAKEDNALPVIHIFQANPNTIEVGEETTITVLATDEDGDALTYIYQPSAGTINGTGATVKWTAPDVPGKYSIKVNVSDGKEFSISSLDVTVNQRQQKETEGLIIPGKQVAGFKINDTIDNIESIYGEGEKEFENPYTYSFYEDFGIIVIFNNRGRVEGIFAVKPNKSTTAGGNGIGSSITSVKNEFGEPDDIDDETFSHWYIEGIGFYYDQNSKVSSIIIFIP